MYSPCASDKSKILSYLAALKTVYNVVKNGSATPTVLVFVAQIFPLTDHKKVQESTRKMSNKATVQPYCSVQIFTTDTYTVNQ